MADSAGYTFGLVGDDDKPERVARCHQAYVDLLERCALETGSPEVAAVVSFLKANPLAQLHLPNDFDRSAKITFRVGDCFVVDLPSVRSFWSRVNDPESDGAHSAPRMQCLVCGQQRPAMQRLKQKVKGIRSGQSTGTSIISANADAFESYGLEASLIAPVCAECAERFTNSVNALLHGQDTHINLGDADFIFWTREPVGFNAYSFLSDPQPGDVKALLESARTGKQAAEVDDTAFYAAVLSGSGGRTVVRDWLDTTVGQAKRHLATWFERQRLVGGWGEEPRPLGLYALAASTVRDANKELAPPTPRALLHAALGGGPLPMNLLYQAVCRNRAEQGVTMPRATLIKLVLLSQPGADREEIMSELDRDNPSPAYKCGRLLAVLEEVQRTALPGAKAGIVDRFFGTASSAPASVFGRLLRGAQPHLAKLERDMPGAYHRLQQSLEEVMQGLSGFPRTLSLEEQGLFSLGYYHQRAWDRARMMQAVQDKKSVTGGNQQEG
jgi:CRISPR-associated protein Csd1